MINGIQLDSGKYGLRAIITSAWMSEMETYLRDNNVVELELNEGKGWRGSDISFVTKLTGLKSFTMFDLRIESIAAIMSLTSLESLELMTYCTTRIDFRSFHLLKECSLEWRPGADSLFACIGLEKLFINKYKGADLSRFAPLVNLTSLAILGAPILTLLGIESLTKLTYLRLANLKRLSSLDGLQNLERLQDLEINTCRGFASIDEIGSLTSLRKLSLSNDGPIRSLSPLRNLHHLEFFSFYESTNILDGDLSPLKDKNLSRIGFRNRRHYTDRREDFGSAYSR